MGGWLKSSFTFFLHMIFSELKWCQISQAGSAEAIIFLAVTRRCVHPLLRVLPAGSGQEGAHRSVEGKEKLEKGLKSSSIHF